MAHTDVSGGIHGAAVTQLGGNAHFVQYDWDDSVSLSTVVIESVSQVAGKAPELLGDPLYNYVDPDALDQLFEPLRGTRQRERGRVAFEFAGYRVTVRGDGGILINPAGAGPVEFPDGF